MTNNGNYWCKRQDRNMMKTCSIFQRSPLGFQALCYLETDRNIIRQQKHPIYVFNNIRNGSVLWEYCVVLGGCYVIPQHMVKALALVLS